MKVVDAFATSQERGWEALSWVLGAVGAVLGILAAVVLIPGAVMMGRYRKVRTRSSGDVLVAKKAELLANSLSAAVGHPVLQSPWTENVVVAVEGETLTFYRLLGPDSPIAVVPRGVITDVVVESAKFTVGQVPALAVRLENGGPVLSFLPQRQRSLWMFRMRPAELQRAAEELRTQLALAR